MSCCGTSYHSGFSFHLQTLTVAEDPHVPTNDDLAGFWDMVYIQVEHINALFKELTKIRQNGWKKSSEVRNDIWKSNKVLCE